MACGFWDSCLDDLGLAKLTGLSKEVVEVSIYVWEVYCSEGLGVIFLHLIWNDGHLILPFLH